MGVFSQHQGPSNDVKRNAFDLSFDNHLTFNFGDLVPCFVKEVIPGDTWEIDSTVGLNFAPTAFPVQSRIDGAIHFFYVRSRTLWKDFYDWYFGTKSDLVRPYFGPNSNQFKNQTSDDSLKSLGMKSPVGTSRLNDYMGFPTTYVTNELNTSTASSVWNYTGGKFNDVRINRASPTYGYAGSRNYRLLPLMFYFNDNQVTLALFDTPTVENVNQMSLFSPVYSGLHQDIDFFVSSSDSDTCDTRSEWQAVGGLSENYFSNGNPTNASFNQGFNCNDKNLVYFINSVSPFIGTDIESGKITVPVQFPADFFDSKEMTIVVTPYDTRPYTVTSPRPSMDVPVFSYGSFVSKVQIDASKSSYVLDLNKFDKSDSLSPLSDWTSGNILISFFVPMSGSSTNINLYEAALMQVSSSNVGLAPLGFSFTNSVVRDISEYDEQVFGNTEGLQPISEPFRAYEMIYNSFYRDSRNNPYVLDNEIQYNKYIPSDDGGEDTNVYGMRCRNWENDFLTTSQPTPQFGNAPLVGITSSGSMTFEASEDGKTYNVQAVVGDDGSTVESVSYQENLPESVRRSLVSVATSGISINDFRNVNAYQRFLETSMRRGLKAIDQLKAHFDVNASYNALDMPEFIGGQKISVQSTKVNQTVNSDSDPLGSYAGQLSTISSQKHKIRCYCDEPGFIIGIICVYPRPIYSQLVDKMWFKTSNLDCFFPEFNNIGYQPVLNREVSPVQCALSTSTTKPDLLSVFGYQRPWYEYLSSVDQCHGLFRTQLRDFTIQRIFGGVPTLGRDFTVIDNDSLNNIFTVDGVEDKIWGRISFDVKAIRPIPKFGIPKLEPNV